MGNAAVISPYWDTLGGGERYVASFTRLLLDLGWQVDIRWPADFSVPLRDRFGLDLSAARFIPRLSTSDYRLVFWVSDGSLPTSLAAKTIVHFQFPFTHIHGSSPLNLLKSRFYTFVCNSRFTKSFIDPEFNIRSRVIYPPVNTASFVPGLKTKTILYVGRFSHLTQLKNPHLLIESFRQIYKQLPGWKLVIAGGAGVGTASGTLASLSRKSAGLPVQIITNPAFTQLQKLYSSASLFWSASGFGADEQSEPVKVEHFGITPVEAMSAGCVPLLVNLGGHKEIIDQGKNGFLWSTPAELQALTLDLCRHPALLTALADSARQKSKIFDITRFNSGFTALIK